MRRCRPDCLLHPRAYEGDYNQHQAQLTSPPLNTNSNQHQLQPTPTSIDTSSIQPTNQPSPCLPSKNNRAYQPNYNVTSLSPQPRQPTISRTYITTQQASMAIDISFTITWLRTTESRGLGAATWAPWDPDISHPRHSCRLFGIVHDNMAES